MSDENHKHLAVLHDAWATPSAVVASLVTEVAGTAVVDLRRVVHGEANDVYEVTMEAAPSLIVRISHGGADALDREIASR